MQTIPNQTVARLLITCPDKPGIVNAISKFLFEHGANITALDQHSTDPSNGTFFMRLEFQTPDLDLTPRQFDQLFAKSVAIPFAMEWKISYAAKHKRMALMVSKHDHALLELLWRWDRDELAMEIPFIISNHPDLQHFADNFSVPFHHIPVSKENKTTAEQQMLNLLNGQVDGVILARYMQILSSNFVSHFPNNIINIHHSFLPAFVGANPYQQAYDKGVKIIGATAHYVTEDLDMGPIIAQEVAHISHRLDASQLKQLGKDIERSVLAKAVKWHLEDRILVHENKTIVFADH